MCNKVGSTRTTTHINSFNAKINAINCVNGSVLVHYIFAGIFLCFGQFLLLAVGHMLLTWVKAEQTFFFSFHSPGSEADYFLNTSGKPWDSCAFLQFLPCAVEEQFLNQTFFFFFLPQHWDKIGTDLRRADKTRRGLSKKERDALCPSRY